MRTALAIAAMITFTVIANLLLKTGAVMGRESGGAPTGQSHSDGSGTSRATTSAASRRSIANAQDPSNVPTSRHRCPCRSVGKPMRPGR